MIGLKEFEFKVFGGIRGSELRIWEAELRVWGIWGFVGLITGVARFWTCFFDFCKLASACAVFNMCCKGSAWVL